MQGNIDIVTLLSLVVAVIVILKLRSVLGRRTGIHRRCGFGLVAGARTGNESEDQERYGNAGTAHGRNHSRNRVVTVSSKCQERVRRLAVRTAKVDRPRIDPYTGPRDVPYARNDYWTPRPRPGDVGVRQALR